MIHLRIIYTSGKEADARIPANMPIRFFAHAFLGGIVEAVEIVKVD